MSPALYVIYKIAKILVYPLTWVIILSALALFWSGASRPGRRRMCLALVLALAYGLAIPPVAHLLAWSLERRHPVRIEVLSTPTPRYDAVVVLAGGVARKGGLRTQDRLRPQSLDRLLCGRDLMERRLAPLLVLSGGNAEPLRRETPEALIMASFLETLGPRAWEVRLETISRTTYENAVETKRLLGDRFRVALVTSALHMPRAMALFRGQGLNPTAYPCDFTAGPLPAGVLLTLPDVNYLRQSTAAINEWVGLATYGLVGKTMGREQETVTDTIVGRDRPRETEAPPTGP